MDTLPPPAVRIVAELGQVLVGDAAFDGGATPGGGVRIEGREVRPLSLSERDRLVALAEGPAAERRLALLVGEAASGPTADLDERLRAAVEAVALHLAGASMAGPLSWTPLLVARSSGADVAAIGAMGACEADRLARAIAAALPTGTAGAAVPPGISAAALPTGTAGAVGAAVSPGTPAAEGAGDDGWTTIRYPGPGATAGPPRAGDPAAVRDRLAAALLARDALGLPQPVLRFLLGSGTAADAGIAVGAADARGGAGPGAGAVRGTVGARAAGGETPAGRLAAGTDPHLDAPPHAGRPEGQDGGAAPPPAELPADRWRSPAPPAAGPIGHEDRWRPGLAAGAAPDAAPTGGEDAPTARGPGAAGDHPAPGHTGGPVAHGPGDDGPPRTAGAAVAGDFLTALTDLGATRAAATGATASSGATVVGGDAQHRPGGGAPTRRASPADGGSGPAGTGGAAPWAGGARSPDPWPAWLPPPPRTAPAGDPGSASAGDPRPARPSAAGQAPMGGPGAARTAASAPTAAALDAAARALHHAADLRGIPR